MDQELDCLSLYFQTTCGKIVIDPKEEIPVLKTKTDGAVRGLVSVAKYIARSSNNNSSLRGNSLEEKCAIDQWLEYRVTHVDRTCHEKDTQTVLNDLNSYLSDKVYFVGHDMTLADILLYCGLHRLYKDLTFWEKQKYLHLSRWFNNIQHRISSAMSKSPISFQKNLIYSGSPH